MASASDGTSGAWFAGLPGGLVVFVDADALPARTLFEGADARAGAPGGRVWLADMEGQSVRCLDASGKAVARWHGGKRD